MLRAALDRLSDRDREVLNLTFRHRLSEADLAAVIGVSPRRARALLSEASANFDHSAPVVAVLRAAVREGRPRCSELSACSKAGIWPRSPLTPQFASKLARHLESCATCALSRGDRALRAEQISEIPLAIPPGRLRLRITRTALALGSYRRTIANRPDKEDKPRKGDQASPPVPLRSRRGVPKVMAVSSVALAALVVPTALLYRLAADSPHAPPGTALKRSWRARARARGHGDLAGNVPGAVGPGAAQAPPPCFRRFRECSAPQPRRAAGSADRVGPCAEAVSLRISGARPGGLLGP